jgi:hypothetical protein
MWVCLEHVLGHIYVVWCHPSRGLYLRSVNRRDIVICACLLLHKFHMRSDSDSSHRSILGKSASELYRPSDRSLSGKLVPTFADRGCNVVSVMDPFDRILDFLDRGRYCFFEVALQLYSRGWVDLIPDPQLLRKSVSAGNRIRTSVSVARNSDH